MPDYREDGGIGSGGDKSENGLFFSLFLMYLISNISTKFLQKNGPPQMSNQVLLLSFLHIFLIKSLIFLVLSHVQLFVTPWTVAHQAPLSMEFSRQECWSGLPFPTPTVYT